MDFNIGDRVEVIDEALGGLISAIEGDQITFCCDDDFEYTYAASKLLIYDKDGNVIIHQSRVNIEFEKEVYKLVDTPPPQFSISFKGKKPVFDLHLEELAPAHVFQLKHDALNFQLNFARAVIEKASRARQRSIVFIHGVGTGTLREALRKMFSSDYPQIEYFDADYQKYGQGATEIIIHGLGSLGKSI